jgi:hypothetical protein
VDIAATVVATGSIIKRTLGEWFGGVRSVESTGAAEKAGTGAETASRLVELRKRQLELGWDAEAKRTNLQEGIGAARYEQVVGRPVSRTNAQGEHVQGVDFYDPKVGPVSLKGPLGIEKATGKPISFTPDDAQGLAKSVIKDVNGNTATKRTVVDLKGLTEAQRQTVRDAIQKGVGSSPKKEVFFVD